ncbi:MAG: CxxxxCH/CxxCH domain-containing protein [Nitrospiraceae bacterium]|nr:MAG: CxxxxCH/CxxCH domain-containing protein [Nitrospiraceae bacterium]
MRKELNKRIKIIIRSIIVLLFSISGSVAFAGDYPHFEGSSVFCESCHFVSGTEPSLMPPWTVHEATNIDDTQHNTLCLSCHNDVDAPYVKTHSSLQTDNGYGDWTIECRVCHNPHYQKQFDTYGSASYLYSGVSTGVTTTTLTKTGAGWTVNAYQGLLVVPNITQKRYKYKILSNTSDTLTLGGPVNLARAAVGSTFAIVYGGLVNSAIVTPNSGSKTVKLFRSTGTNSFADGNATYDGVCEVCHTQTTYHRNSAAGDHTHNAGTACTDCHVHTKGFKVACDVCHGYPPVVNTATGGPDGLANNPGATGSSTAGAHNVHVNTKGYTCTMCHYNSAGSGATHNNSLTITLGYSLFGGTYQGGSYDGQAGVSYNATTTTPATNVTNTGTKTCSNLYCHSTGQSTTDGSSATPAYASPIWDNPSSGACGTCHKVTEASGLTSGSHAAHLGTTGVNGCGDCHTGAANDASSYNSSNHVNASINVSNTYTAGGAPGNGYGTCSTASCHDDGTGNTAVTPTWGTSVTDCTECHAEIPATGSHQKHVVTTSYNKAVCGNCHGNAVQATTAPTQHLDGNLDVYDSAAGDLGYPQNVAKGGAPYDSCSTAYCHSTGQSTTDGSSSTPTYATVTWGGSAVCGSCHKVTEASGLTSGSHAAHLGTTGVNGCGDCHAGTANDASTYNSITHVDGNIDVDNTYTADGAPGNGYGTCSTASCHDDGTGLPAVTRPWGTNVTDCSECHATVPATGSHQKHVVSTNYKKAVCGDCHNGAVQGTTAPSQHKDGNLDVYYSSPGDLGYPLNVAKGGAPYDSCSTVYCHSTGQSTSNANSSTPTYATVTWGGTAVCGTCHKVTQASGLTSGSHSAHLLSDSVSGCADCHTGAANNASTYDSTSHINAQIDVANSYTAGGDPGNGYGTCSAAACHGSGSPAWGTDFTGIDICTKCHGTPTATPAPNYAKAPPKDTAGDTAATDAQVGAHQAHLQATLSNDIACSQCHTVPSAVSDAGHINDATPGTAELTFGALASYNSATPAYAAGECSTVYCHGGAMPGGTTDGADRTPEWNNTNYLTGVAANDCSRCHGYPPANALHSGKLPTDCIRCHDTGVNAAGTGFTDASTHINGVVNIADDCFDCHSSRGGVTPGTSGDPQHEHHVQTAYNGKVSQGDYGKLPNWYSYSNLGGVPDKACGYCHPQSSATHMNGVINLNFDPNDTGAAGTMKAKNAPVQSYSQVQRTSVTCSSVYCHSSGYFDGTTYQYKTSPNWYGGTFVGNKCDDCHGNMPDTSSHMSHGRVALHYDTIFSGTTGLAAASGGVGSGAGHGDPNTSTTINCNLCHYNVVKMAANDKNTVCAECHGTTAALVGTMVIDPSATSHVTGAADVDFAPVMVRSRAQIRDDITKVSELDTYWQRNNGYKQGVNSYDSSKATLSSESTYNSGTQTCSTVSCHNGIDIKWNTNISSCSACHLDLPRTDQ